MFESLNDLLDEFDFDLARPLAYLMLDAEEILDSTQPACDVLNELRKPLLGVLEQEQEPQRALELISTTIDDFGFEISNPDTTDEPDLLLSSCLEKRRLSPVYLALLIASIAEEGSFPAHSVLTPNNDAFVRWSEDPHKNWSHRSKRFFQEDHYREFKNVPDTFNDSSLYFRPFDKYAGIGIALAAVAHNIIETDLMLAQQLCDLSLIHLPNYPSAFIGKSIIEQAKGNYPMALEYANMALKSNPLDTTPYFHTAHSLINLNEKQKALEQINKRLDVLAECAQARNLRGSIHYALGKNDEALEDFSFAIEKDPTLFGPHLNRAQIHADRKDKILACADLDAALLIEPERPETYKIYACILEELGEFALVPRYMNLYMKKQESKKLAQ